MNTRVLASLMTRVLLFVGPSTKAKDVRRKQRVADARKACTCVASANVTITVS